MLKKRFDLFVEEKNLFTRKDKILLTVSGGMDSMVMAELFLRSNFSFGIAHCNFGLRENESDDDELFVNDFAKRNSIPIYSKKFETKLFATGNKLSTQEAARKLRYEWFEEVRAKDGYDYIATAHHLDDSIETFFINLIRKSGPKGLSGISVTNDKVIRPLLFATRKNIEDFVKNEQIGYREDSSNLTDDYLRNRLRHHLIPALRDEHFEELMSVLMEDFGEISLYFDEKAKRFEDEYVHIHGEVISIPLIPLLAMEEPAEFLSLLLYRHGIKNAETGKMLLTEVSGKEFDTARHLILRDRKHLLIRPKKDPKEEEILVNQFPEQVEVGGNRIHFEKWEEKRIDQSPGVQCIDAARLHSPLKIRRWKAGDAFIPLGMKQQKKVSDFLIDLKINRFEKDSIFVLLSNHDIVCILGLRIDERFKVTEQTQQTLTLTVSPHA